MISFEGHQAKNWLGGTSYKMKVGLKLEKQQYILIDTNLGYLMTGQIFMRKR